MSKIVQFPSKDESPAAPADGLRLHLGCNQHPIEGYINVDMEPFKGVDVVTDLEKVWPWPDGSVSEILANDLAEHLRQCYEEPSPVLLQRAEKEAEAGNYAAAFKHVIGALRKPHRTYGIIHFMEEAGRVLRIGGLLKLKIPTTESRAWAQDPTHVSYWNENTFMYWLNDTYRAFYPSISARFKGHKVGTTVRNAMDESWVIAVLERV